MRRLLFPHLAVFVIGAALVRIVLVPAEVCPPATAAQVRAAISAAGDWAERGLRSDGRYLYGYTRDSDVVNQDYNSARHAGIVNSLYQTAAAGEMAHFATAEAGLGYMLDNLVGAGDWAAFAEPFGGIPLGANGLFLAALAHRRMATGDTSHDDLMRRVGRFVVGQQQEDGSMLAYRDRATGLPVPGVFGPFATGEAFWALTLMNRLFPGEGWDRPAVAVSHYLAERRGRAEGYVARLPDHWGAYGLAELFEQQGLDDVQARYARRLAGYFGIRIRVEAQRRGEGLNLLVRGWPGPPAGVGTSGEGMGALHRFLGDDPRTADLAPNLAERIECTAGILVEGQLSAEEAAEYARPEFVEGAWFYREYTQVDDQQHVISALLGALPVLEGGA